VYNVVHVTVSLDSTKVLKFLQITVLFLLDRILNYTMAVIGYSALLWCLQVRNSLTHTTTYQ